MTTKTPTKKEQHYINLLSIQNILRASETKNEAYFIIRERLYVKFDKINFLFLACNN